MRSVVPACWLLLWTLTAPASCNDGSVIEVTHTADDEIKLSCSGNYQLRRGNGSNVDSLEYRDENSGEYECIQTTGGTNGSKIYVKFRTCDNCVELNAASITGLVVGNVVATIGIGWAVYVVASQTRIAPVTSHKKRSDRQPLVHNDMSRAPNDHYQPLNVRQKDEYDVLNRR
ncbi:T-cell surface glycoprotein CD3 gamma chain-like [Clinocottus analis]|uniref:T-cell surface glycoprotein CD3 gamma chain-like n=1 Tax=Clinocottus analis TaxID=304258 RepID=UPI0035C176F8